MTAPRALALPRLGIGVGLLLTGLVLVDFLARKGHGGSGAREAARQALDERDSGVDGPAGHRVEFR